MMQQVLTLMYISLLLLLLLLLLLQSCSTGMGLM
jgi:hypothetical protein